MRAVIITRIYRRLVFFCTIQVAMIFRLLGGFIFRCYRAESIINYVALPISTKRSPLKSQPLKQIISEQKSNMVSDQVFTVSVKKLF